MQAQALDDLEQLPVRDGDEPWKVAELRSIVKTLNSDVARLVDEVEVTEAELDDLLATLTSLLERTREKGRVRFEGVAFAFAEPIARLFNAPGAGPYPLGTPANASLDIADAPVTALATISGTCIVFSLPKRDWWYAAM